VAVFDYEPKWAGRTVDPVPNGGQVTHMDLYSVPERTGIPVATAGPAARLGVGRYRWTLPDTLPDGRYWALITFTVDGTTVATDRITAVDMPTGTGLVTSPEAVAVQAGVPLPLTATQRDRYLQAIADSQADVAAYLKRALVPEYRTFTNVQPNWQQSATADVNDWRVWQNLMPGYDDFDVDEVTPTPVDGQPLTYTVTLRLGLEPDGEKAARRYVLVHATEGLRLAGEMERRPISVSADGQSVMYERKEPSPGQANSLPMLSELDPFVAPPVFTRRRNGYVPWPYL
jgi:hypothetical protein